MRADVARLVQSKPAPWIWEVYLTDPRTNPDPSTWRTELNQPLQG